MNNGGTLGKGKRARGKGSTLGAKIHGTELGAKTCGTEVWAATGGADPRVQKYKLFQNKIKCSETR